MGLSCLQIRPDGAPFEPKLIIFDKGGTLIDFRAMWGDWLVELASRLEAKTGLAVREHLFAAMGFAPDTGAVDPLGHLALDSRAELKKLSIDLLEEMNLDAQTAHGVVGAIWFVPDPVADAHPVTPLQPLFQDLRLAGLRIAVATMDDRAPTEVTLAHMGVRNLVDALVCADDGLDPKPAPDMVTALCRWTGIDPLHTVVVGDSLTDLQMGRAAGVGMVAGVGSGVTPADMLAAHADVVLESVAELVSSSGLVGG
jgi:phosphoglycolate phosphatase